MEDFKLEHTEPDKVYETVSTIKNEQPQYLYYEIEVSRKQTAFINVRVAADNKIDRKNAHKIAKAAVEQNVKNYDWEDDYFNEIEVEQIKQVSADEALEYDVYEA
jgi:divalent metal cation (Fe/Co/Zn/Cd) transporter